MTDSVALHDDERTAHWQAMADDLCSRTGVHRVSVTVTRQPEESPVAFQRLRGRRAVYELTVNEAEHGTSLDDDTAMAIEVAETLLTQVSAQWPLMLWRGATTAATLAFVVAAGALSRPSFGTGLDVERASYFAAAIGCVVLFVVGELVHRRATDRRLAALFGRDEVARWLAARQNRLDFDTRLRVRRLGGTTPRRRGRTPSARPRTVLSWPAAAATLAMVWLVLYAMPSLSALAHLDGVDLTPPLPPGWWAVLYESVRYVATSVLAVVLWVGVKRWRGLTWTQVGVPYQRWLRRRLPHRATLKSNKTELSKLRRLWSIAAGLSFVGANSIAAIVAAVVGGMSPENGMGADNAIEAVFQCVRAGIFEELGFIAIPAAIVLYRTTVDRPVNVWLYVGLVIGSGIARAVPHMYYGAGGFIWAFTWGALVMAAYLRWRRILPLITAHIAVDLTIIATGLG